MTFPCSPSLLQSSKLCMNDKYLLNLSFPRKVEIQKMDHKCTRIYTNFLTNLRYSTKNPNLCCWFNNIFFTILSDITWYPCIHSYHLNASLTLPMNPLSLSSSSLNLRNNSLCSALNLTGTFTIVLTYISPQPYPRRYGIPLSLILNIL